MVSEAKGINLAGYICRMIANICIHFLSQCTSEVYRTVISRIETEIIRKENAIGCKPTLQGCNISVVAGTLQPFILLDISVFKRARIIADFVNYEG